MPGDWRGCKRQAPEPVRKENALFFGLFYIDARAPHLVRTALEFLELLVHAGIREQAGGLDPLDTGAKALTLASSSS